MGQQLTQGFENHSTDPDMLPIATNLKVRETPWATYTLVSTNTVIHLLLSWDNNLALPDKIVRIFGFVHAHIVNLHPTAFPTLFTAMFLHGDLLHLIGNMLFLSVFGRKVESQLGMQNYIAFYLITGVTATMAHGMIDPTSPIPVIGASGAISGVLGAFTVYNYKARITLLPDPVLFYVMVRYLRRFTLRFPAWIFLPVWFGIQLLEGLQPEHAGVAFWAHIGGFLMGASMAIVVSKYVPTEKFSPKG
jgi:membrane associated rhomboid family serine protease